MSQYIFSAQDKKAEYERLCLIQDSFDEKTQKHLLKAGLKEGMDCLEVGVGAGSIILWMKEQLSSDSLVVGVDLDTSHLEDEELQLIQGDILDLDIDKKFDLIHLRYVLIHNNKAKEILTKLYSLLKPNGKLIIEEPDFTLAKWMDTEHRDACKRVNSAICKMYETRGLKAHYGSIMHLGLEEIGFEIEETRSYLHLCSGGEDVAKLMLSSTKALSKEYIDTKLCSEDDIEKYITSCDDPESLAVYYATVAIIASKSERHELELENAETKEDGFYFVKTDTEIKECFSLMQVLRSHLKVEDYLCAVKKQMQDGYKMIYLLAEGKIVSLAGYRISSNLAWGKYLYIDDLVSLETRRSMGYGKRLLAEVIELAKQEECKQLHLDSGVQRFEAHRFYLREGFKISSHHFSMEL
jgi:ubiquinone/menaquinone biosynthesis C-methylase UbiE/GNAT superfamily N-acetyltransferase